MSLHMQRELLRQFAQASPDMEGPSGSWPGICKLAMGFQEEALELTHQKTHASSIPW